MVNSNKKKDVHDFWDKSSCGEELFMSTYDKDNFLFQSKKRYELEPYIADFADFKSTKNKNILEIGVGLGADHQKFIEAGANTTGIDLTGRAIKNTETRLGLFGLKSSLSVCDAENLKFDDNSFDEVYSWGVIHHSPDTKQAVKEICRVLAPEGVAKVMIYHKWSIVGMMLWFRYALMVFKPFTSLDKIYASYLESPGTKAYTKDEALELFRDFSEVKIKTVLTHGDLLTSDAGQRHEGKLLNIARRIWPRFLIKLFFPRAGLFMLIKAIK